MNAGPYETEREAMAASLWEKQDRRGDMDVANRTHLYAALDGVELGAYDRRIVEWLVNYEPSTVAVVCGLISRARAAGKDTGDGPGTAQPGGGWISGPSA